MVLNQGIVIFEFNIRILVRRMYQRAIKGETHYEVTFVVWEEKMSL